MVEWLLFALTGVFAGLTAGLLGLGGGLVIVPALAFIFTLQNMADAHVMHVAIGTSLMTITMTSLSAMLAHHRKGTVDWQIFKQLLCGLLVGGIMGSLLASFLSSEILQRVFTIYVLLVAIKMWVKNKPDNFYILPGWIGSFFVGTGIGSISAILGIGGGSMMVPYLIAGNKTMHQAVGTAAACGFPIAVAGVAGFILMGYEAGITTGGWHSGFINWKAFLGIIMTSIVFATIGAGIAKRMSVSMLRQLFSIFLLGIGIYMW